MDEIASAGRNDAQDALTSSDDAGGFLESVDRSGRVIGRIAITHLPIYVGRAYTNDLIVDDPFVDAVHVRIERDPSGHFQTVDLDSVNGLYRDEDRSRVNKAVLDGTTSLGIGHTILRYRPLNWRVPPTRFDRSRRNLLRLFELRWLQLALILLAGTLTLVTGIMSQATRLEVLEHTLVLTALVTLILLWAGFWSLINRLLQHRMNFPIHAGIASLAVVASIAADTLSGYLAHLLDWDTFYEWASAILSLVIFTTSLYLHLRFCTIAKPATLARALGIITLALLLPLGLGRVMQQSEFSGTPQYYATFKPVTWSLRGPIPLPQFLEEAGALSRELDRDRAPKTNP